MMLSGQCHLQRGKAHHVIIGVVLLTATLLFVYSSRLNHREDGGQQGIAVTDILGGGDTAGYARAYEPRDFSFPRDFGPHPDYRHEWWYYTGNLKTSSGRLFGFQLTFFRFSLGAHETQRDSQWSATQMMMAHFALSDIDEHKFYQHEKTSRVALGLAGSTAQPFKVWVDNWSVARSPDAAWPMTLHAGDDRFDVSGHSWLDREWGTSSLAANQSGWDWFALQLSDGSDLMAYRLRRKDGSVDHFSSGMMIAQDGGTHPLTADAFTIQNLSRWRSPHTRILYPSRWHLSVPAEALELEIEPLLHDQELHASINYWEGAVWIHGMRNNRNVTGYGYVELTGYDQTGLQIDIN